MRARAVLTLALAGLAAFIVIAIGTSSTPAYRAAAIFDSAEGIVPGQLVKIAGARVGTITAVRLRPGPSARIEFTVDRRYAPFHADARCQILPEGPISENYVECTPGSRSAPALVHATVPITRTSVPVSLQDLLNIFSLPVDERLSVLINELGIGTAGRGTDLNAILRRADPALTQGDRVLAILNAQNTQLAAAVHQTRSVLGELAAHQSSVRAFIDHAASVASTSAEHQAALAAGVARMPALLTALRTDLRPVDRLATRGEPLLADLRRSAPGLLQLTATLPAFARPGLPGIAALGRAADHGLSALSAARPVASQLERLGTIAPTVLTSLDQLLVSTRDSGAFEGFLRLLYSLSTDSGGYDAISHYVTALIIPFPTCMSNPSTPGCDHAYSAPGQGSVPINDASAGPTNAAAHHRHPVAPASPRAHAPAVTPPAPAVPAIPSVPAPASALRPLLNYLLR